MHSRIFGTSSVVALVLVVASLASGPSGAAGASGPSQQVMVASSHPVFPPGTRPLGTHYRVWATRWLKWLQEIPVRRNPAVHPNSRRNCELVRGAVMMGPTGTGHGCRVRPGRPVVFAVLGHECSTAEGNGETWRELRRCTRQGWRDLRGVEVAIRIDGRRLRKPRRWTFETVRAVVDLPRRNIWGAPPGPTRSLGKGMFHVVRPMARGTHLIRARVSDGGQRTVFHYRFTVR